MNKTIKVLKNQKRVWPILWKGDEENINITVQLSQPGAEIVMPVLLIGKISQKLALNITIIHEKPRTKSQLTVKGILYDAAKVEFDGLVKIQKKAKESNAWLEADLLLMSDSATGRAVPNLEIDENDVKAGHAATIGQVDQEELFYLLSRGLDHDQAISLIGKGFVQKLLQLFPANLAKKATEAVGL